jgi:hypothetical protein
MQALRQRDPTRFASLFEQLRRYERRRERFGVSEEALQTDVPWRTALRFALRESALGILFFPLLALGTAVFFAPYQIVRLLARLFPTTLDQQATLKVASGAILYGLWMLGIAVVAGSFLGTPWGIACAAGLPLLGVVTLLVQEREAAMLDVTRGYLASRLTHDRTEGRLLRQRAALATLLEETYRWLEAPAERPVDVVTDRSRSVS